MLTCYLAHFCTFSTLACDQTTTYCSCTQESLQSAALFCYTRLLLVLRFCYTCPSLLPFSLHLTVTSAAGVGTLGPAARGLRACKIYFRAGLRLQSVTRKCSKLQLQMQQKCSPLQLHYTFVTLASLHFLLLSQCITLLLLLIVVITFFATLQLQSLHFCYTLLVARRIDYTFCYSCLLLSRCITLLLRLLVVITFFATLFVTLTCYSRNASRVLLLLLVLITFLVTFCLLLDASITLLLHFTCHSEHRLHFCYALLVTGRINYTFCCTFLLPAVFTTLLLHFSRSYYTFCCTLLVTHSIYYAFVTLSLLLTCL